MPLFITGVARKELFSGVPVIHTTSATIEKKHSQMTNGLSCNTLSRLQRRKGLWPLPVELPPLSLTQKPARSTEAALGARKIQIAHSPTGEGCQHNLPGKKKYLGETPSHLPGEHGSELDQIVGNRHSGIRRQNHRARGIQGCKSTNGREKAAATLFFAEAGKRHWVAHVFVLNIARIHVDDSVTFS